MSLVPTVARHVWTPCIIAVGLLVLFVWIRLCIVYSQIRRNRRRQQQQQQHPPNAAPVPVLIVLGSGGHTTEMLFMTKQLNADRYGPIHYCKASTDSTSSDRVSTMMRNDTAPSSSSSSSSSSTKTPSVVIHNIPRSREVGQSYLSSVFSTLYAFQYAFALVGRLRPQLILCNGPGTCIPICVAALWYRIMALDWDWRSSRHRSIHNTGSTIVFIESYCRVQTLSLTGRLLYYVVDLFIVHWPELHDKYPDTVLTKSFIQQDKR